MNEPFSAHGKVNPKTGDYINFGFGVDVQGGRPKTIVNMYRVNKQGKMVAKTKLPLPRAAFLHDFAMSERYGFFLLSSIGASSTSTFLQSLIGMRPMKDALSYRPDMPAIAWVVDLETMELIMQVEMEPHAVVHFGNAWEAGDELIVDAMYFDNFRASESLNDMWHAERMHAGHAHQYRINLKTKNIVHESVSESPFEVEFPQWQQSKSLKPTRYMWTAANAENGAVSFFNAMQKIDTKTGKTIVAELPKGYYGAEPMPVLNNRKEDDGYVLMVVYNAWNEKSELWCFNAEDLSVRAKAYLPHHIPHGFHGYWLDQSRL